MVTGSPSGGVDKDKILGPELEGEIKAICRDLLERCGAEYKIVPFSNFDLWDACWTHVQNEYHIHRDDTTGAFPKLHKYIRLGVLMADTSYAHILDLKLRVWIALFTALTTYLDDVVSSDNHHLRTFTGVLLLGRSHDHPVLNAFISFLKDMPDKFDDFIVNMVVSASMRYLMSIALEVEGKSDQISPHGRKYPGYVRSLSGMPDAYGVFAFPLHLPRSTYIQALPEVMEFVYAINDVLSLFKEELEGETTNYISMESTRTSKSKIETAKEVAFRAIDAHQTVLKILAPQPEALDAWRSYARGYCIFHCSEPRHSLGELLSSQD